MLGKTFHSFILKTLQLKCNRIGVGSIVTLEQIVERLYDNFIRDIDWIISRALNNQNEKSWNRVCGFGWEMIEILAL